LFLAFVLYKQIRKTPFTYTCIALCAAIVCVFMFLFFLVIEGDQRTITEILNKFPQIFADIVIVPIILLGVMMFISNIALMRHEGMRPTNMIGTFLGVICVAGTVGIFAISQIIMYKAKELNSLEIANFGVCLSMWFYCILDYCECIMIGIIIMGYVAAKKKGTFDSDFVIIPGCSISKTGGLLPLLRGRTNRAVRYAWEQEIATGKKVIYVPSGGQGSDEIMSEGAAMEMYLLAHGAESDEILPEKKSVNTYENFLFSKRIIDSQMPNAKVAFATTNYHVLRCGMIATSIGMNVEGLSSLTKWYFWPNGFAREVIAIFKMTLKHHIAAVSILAIVALILLSL